jgi:hypothetical protein
MKKTELIEAIEAKKIEITKKQKEIDCWEPDQDDYVSSYEEALDEQGDIVIGSLRYSPSYVLKEVDPIAYDCGLNDYIDSLEIEPEELQEELEGLEEELENLKDELSEIEK